MIGGGVVIWLLDYLRIALDVILDVVNHFGTEFNQERNSDDTIRKNRIRKRFETVLRTLRKRESPVRLVVVSHSQGTITAVDVLSNEKASEDLVAGPEIVLVTIGSPLSHLYNYYFPKEYPALENPQWQHLPARVSRWVNIFRIDDFVGTEIPGSAVEKRSEGSERRELKVENQPVDRGGHLGYWSNRKVHEELSNILDSDLRQAAAIRPSEDLGES